MKRGHDLSRDVAQSERSNQRNAFRVRIIDRLLHAICALKLEN